LGLPMAWLKFTLVGSGMMKKILYCYIGLMLLGGATTHAKEIHKGTYLSMSLGMKLNYTVHAPEKVQGGTNLPIAVYMKNLPIARLGQESDETILNEILQQGVLVAVVDFQGKSFPSELATLAEFCNLRSAFGGKTVFSSVGRMKEYHMDHNTQGLMPYTHQVNEKGEKTLHHLVFTDVKSGHEFAIGEHEIYVLPEGFTLKRHIVLAKNGNATGGAKEHFMDVIYPAKPKVALPTILDVSTKRLKQKDHPFALNPNSDYTMSYTYFGYAFASSAYALEVNDKGKQRTGLHAPESKAIRMLRAKKETWGLSGKIGIFGISKGSARSLLACVRSYGDTPRDFKPLLKKAPYSYLYNGADFSDFVKDIYLENNEMDRFTTLKRQNKFTFEKTTLYKPEKSAFYKPVSAEKNPGPHADQSDRPDVGYATATGYNVIVQVLPYIKKDIPPMYIGVGKLEMAGQIKETTKHNHIPSCGVVYRSIRDIFDDVGVTNYIYEEQEDLGHEFNYFKYTEIKTFFGKHLK
jgi:hypothetical protein